MKPANVLLEPQSNGISLHALIVKTLHLFVYVCNFAESADEEVSVSENSESTDAESTDAESTDAESADGEVSVSENSESTDAESTDAESADGEVSVSEKSESIDAESADGEVSVSENSHSTLEQHQSSPVPVSSPGPQAEPYGKFITLHCVRNELVLGLRSQVRCTYLGNIGM